jgi:hypothetical protein
MVLAASVVAAGILTGCGGSALPSVPVESPAKTALAWFEAVDHHDLRLALAHFAPPDRGQMEWGGSAWPYFAHVRCRGGQTGNEASAGCSFVVRNAHGSFFGFQGWVGMGVWMERKPGGPWLITSWGQG